MTRTATVRTAMPKTALKCLANLPKPPPSAPCCAICDHIAPLFWVDLSGQEQAICARCEQDMHRND